MNKQNKETIDWLERNILLLERKLSDFKIELEFLKKAKEDCQYCNGMGYVPWMGTTICECCK